MDELDLRILRQIQSQSNRSVRELARELRRPITTVHGKIRRMEKAGIIKAYRAVLDAKKLDRSAAAFILISVAYRPDESSRLVSQRDVAEELARFPEVQEVHIVTGDWDILVKTRTRDVESLGKMIIDRLRIVKGVVRTLSCIVLDSIKETTELNV